MTVYFDAKFDKSQATNGALPQVRYSNVLMHTILHYISTVQHCVNNTVPMHITALLCKSVSCTVLVHKSTITYMSYI